MNDSFKTLLAFLGGATAGVALGILLAPEKGSETRKKILSRAKDLTDDLSDVARDKYEDLLSWKDSMLDGAEESVAMAENGVRRNVNKVADKAENKIRNAHI